MPTRAAHVATAYETKQKQNHLAIKVVVQEFPDVDSAVAEVVASDPGDLVHDKVSAENAYVALEHSLSVHVVFAPVATIHHARPLEFIPPVELRLAILRPGC